MQNPRRRWIVKAGWLAVALSFCRIITADPAMAIETPNYKVLSKQGAFELRDYPAQTVAEVVVDGDQQGAVQRGFRELAGYIFGGNSTRQTISMTAPVGQTPLPQTPLPKTPLPKTPADPTALGARQWIVRFDMPRELDLAALPKPKNPSIRLLSVPPTRIASVRFSGLMSDGAARKETAALLAHIRSERLEAAGPPTLAQYDPPWTLWFLRRNEVLIPVADGPDHGYGPPGA